MRSQWSVRVLRQSSRTQKQVPENLKRSKLLKIEEVTSSENVKSLDQVTKALIATFGALAFGIGVYTWTDTEAQKFVKKYTIYTRLGFNDAQTLFRGFNEGLEIHIDFFEYS